METLQTVFQGAAAKEINYVQYSIFLPPQPDNKRMLQEAWASIQSLIQPHIEDYLWQQDRFNLLIVESETRDPPYPFLQGITRFGDCINDEWFIVFLLYEISRTIPDAVITVSDNDGDVLLIEAAMVLPSWLEPSNSLNRVYIYKGQVHIIPLPSSPADIMQIPSVTAKLKREQAVDIVRQSSVNTLASDSIQEAIRERIMAYPEASADETHWAKCILPEKAAYVLLKEPQLLPLAVDAFYLRDPVALKACAAMRKFPPIRSLELSIRFTKTTFAQTVSQRFYAPKSFRLPPVSQKSEYKRAELGMKLACGLEMLYADDARNVERDSDAPLVSDDDPHWKNYLARLTRLGYFRDERPGSKLYRQLKQQAKEQLTAHQKQRHSITDRVDVDDPNTFAAGAVLGNTTPRKRIDELLQNFSPEDLQELVDANGDREDDDAWMRVDPTQLEDMLTKRMGLMNDDMLAEMENELSLDDDEPTVNLEKMMSKFEDFVENRKSDVDGVKFPGENTDSDQDDSDDGSDEEEDKPISFDIDRFMSILRGTPGAPENKTMPEPSKETESKTTEPKGAEPKSTEQEGAEEETLKDLMEEMDQEIAGHEKINASFETAPEDEDAPVDIKLNLVKNILDSYKSQQGLPGPIGNILGQFGIVLPADKDQEDT